MRLIIECMGFAYGKAYGFQEYLFNLLDYMHNHREKLLYDEVVILCKPSQLEYFKKYSNRFVVKGVKGSESYLGRLVKQTMLPIDMHVAKNDTVLYPGNFSGFIKCCHHVIVIHDLLYKHRNLMRNKAFIAQREIFVASSVKMADVIIGISEFVANEIRCFFPRSSKKVVPIYNYMNFTKYGCGPLNEDGGYFMSVAADHSHKNLATVFKAYCRYCEAGGSRKMIFIGSVGEKSEAGRALANLPRDIFERIIFYRGVSNVELGRLYQKATAFITASLFEGFGMPVAEAMYFHLPMLMSDIEIHREISMGKGLYFPAQDEKVLADLMLKVKFKRIDYGASVIERYDYGNTSAKYVEILNQILED